MKAGQTAVPYWKEGSRVEVTQTGLTGTVRGYVVTGPADAQGRVGVMRDLCWVQLDRISDSQYSRKLVQVHATGLRAVLNTNL